MHVNGIQGYAYMHVTFHVFREVNISFSIRSNGKLKRWRSGPSSFSISLRLLMSVLLTARISGVVAQ